MYDSQEAIAYYEDVAPLNAEHGIYTVRHIETGQIYIKKIMYVYSLAVYAYLFENPINGIPHIYALYEHEGTLTVIEEYIPGNTIQALLDRGGVFSELEVVNYTTQLCKTLAKLHSLTPPIVHRDIKPSNIILTEDDRVVLIDLNAARIDDEESDHDTRLLGTSGYAAPEQYGFGKSSVTADIYALGILMQVMLIGCEDAPISGNGQTDARILTKEDLPCSARLAQVIRRCTQLDPGKRYPSADELAKALRKKAPFKRIVAGILVACTVLGVAAAGLNYMQNMFGEDTSQETRIASSEPDIVLSESMPDIAATHATSGKENAQGVATTESRMDTVTSPVTSEGEGTGSAVPTESLTDIIATRATSNEENTESIATANGAIDSALVGVYKGDIEDILVLRGNGLADYYVGDDEYTELAMPWSVTDGVLAITFPKLHCTATADIADSSDELYLVSSDMGWTDEVFHRTSQTPDEYGHPAVKCADSNTVMNEEGYLICTLGGLQFTIPRQYVDEENSYDDRDDASAYWSIKYKRYYEADLIIGVDTKAIAPAVPDQTIITEFEYVIDGPTNVAYYDGIPYQVAGYNAWISQFTATTSTNRGINGALTVIYNTDAEQYLYVLFLGGSGAYEAEIGDILDMLDTAISVDEKF